MGLLENGAETSTSSCLLFCDSDREHMRSARQDSDYYGGIIVAAE